MSRVASEALVLSQRAGLASRARVPAGDPPQSNSFAELLSDVSNRSEDRGSTQVEANASASVKRKAPPREGDKADPKPRARVQQPRADFRTRDDNQAAPDDGPTQPSPIPVPGSAVAPNSDGDQEDQAAKAEVTETVAAAGDLPQLAEVSALEDVTLVNGVVAGLVMPASDANPQLTGVAVPDGAETDALPQGIGEATNAGGNVLRPPVQQASAEAAVLPGSADEESGESNEQPAPGASADGADPMGQQTSVATDGSRKSAGGPDSEDGGDHPQLRAGSADTRDALVAQTEKSTEASANAPREDETGAPREAAKPAADASQLVNPPPPADRFGHLTPAAPSAHSGAAATAETSAAVPIAGLAVEIATRAQSGGNRFEIRLDPPELGRIDVRLDLDHRGNVTSHLIVEKAETLDLLKRDAPELERALQQAGLKTSDSGLQFTLRDQQFAGRDGGRPAPETARIVVPDPDLAPVEAVQSSYGRRLDGGIDIRV